MKTNKAIVAGIISLIIGIGMLAMPLRAMAHDWDDDGDGWHHDHGHHYGWFKHGGDRDDDQWRYRQDRDEDEDEDSGYRYGSGYGYGYGFPNGQRALPRNGEGMINPSNPNQIWACDSHGHHCHWAQIGGYPRTGYFDNYGYGNGYYGNNNYGNGYYSSSPFSALGSIFGFPMP